MHNSRDLGTGNANLALNELTMLKLVLEKHVNILNGFVSYNSPYANIEDRTFENMLKSFYDKPKQYVRYEDWLLQTYNENTTENILKELNDIFRAIEAFNVVLNNDAFKDVVDGLDLDLLDGGEGDER